MLENRRWLIIPATKVNEVNFNQVKETSADSLRYSLDGTKTFIKYDVTIIEEDYERTYIDAETNEEKTQLVEAGIYGRPSIFEEGLGTLQPYTLEVHLFFPKVDYGLYARLPVTFLGTKGTCLRRPFFLQEESRLRIALPWFRSYQLGTL